MALGKGVSSASLLALTLAACVATPIAPPPRGILVGGPPPPMLVEERTPAPAPLATWVAGYWHWTGLQYAWIPGHWDAARPSGATWHAPAYVQNNGSYFYEPGSWTPAAERPAAAPPPNAAAFR